MGGQSWGESRWQAPPRAMDEALPWNSITLRPQKSNWIIMQTDSICRKDQPLPLVSFVVTAMALAIHLCACKIFTACLFWVKCQPDEGPWAILVYLGCVCTVWIEPQHMEEWPRGWAELVTFSSVLSQLLESQEYVWMRPRWVFKLLLCQPSPSMAHTPKISDPHMSIRVCLGWG